MVSISNWEKERDPVMVIVKTKRNVVIEFLYSIIVMLLGLIF